MRTRLALVAVLVLAAGCRNAPPPSVGVLATPAHAAHVRQYTPSRSAVVHTVSHSGSKHHLNKLVKSKKHKHGKKGHGKKK